jgi:hypothetical protein
VTALALDGPRGPGAPPPDALHDAASRAVDPAAWLLCARCWAPIAPDAARVAVQGQHQHVFSNPYGYLYEIGCFSVAPGCDVDPDETTRWSWFPGFAWAVASCATCQQHLGWRFRGAATFFGLILERLAPGQPAGGA